MLRFLCDKYPYLLVVFFFLRAATEPPGETKRKRFFLNLLSCCVLSLLLKCLFAGERPSIKIQDNWQPLESISLNRGRGKTSKRSLTITPGTPYEALRMQPVKEIFSPPSLSEIKEKLLPFSGTPSSHSFLSGFLMEELLSKKRAPFVRLSVLLFLSYSRILFSFHFPYQVILGVLLGALYGRVKRKIIFCYG